MACRTFRAVLLGTIRDPQISTNEMVFIFENTPTFDFSITGEYRANDPAFPEQDHDAGGVVDIKLPVEPPSIELGDMEVDISSCG